MANNIHSLRSPITKDSRRAAGLSPAARRADYALFADRGSQPKAAPANYTLSAELAVPSGAAPPEFSLVADKKPVTAAGQTRRLLYSAIAAAVFLHLLIVSFFLAHPGMLKMRGREDGAPETLNVSVVSSADLKRLADPFRQDGNPSQAPDMETPAPPPQPPQEQQTPQEQQPAPPEPKPAQEAKAAPDPQLKKNERHTTDYDPSGYIAMASQQFSAQLDHAFKAAEARRDANAQRSALTASQPTMAARNVKVFRPGASHSGKSDEFAQAVIWALGATKPMGNGKWGTVIVTFTVTGPGPAGGLQLLKSSGDNWLDTAALMAVRQARMPTPPPGLPAPDRTFVIEYISTPGGR